MSINEENSNAFDVATLARFAKNCNLINSQQFENLATNKTKSLDPSIFKVPKLPDYQFYDKAGFDGFKSAIADTVFANFLKLLLTNSVFAGRMAKTMFSLEKGFLTEENLKFIILNKIRNEINDIAVRISNGEQLTAEEIQELIEGALFANVNEIALEAEILSSTTTPEGLSAATLFPQLALFQRNKGIRWRPIKGSTLSPKQLERLKKTTKQIKSLFEKARGAITTARSIVALLKKLESIYNNGLIGILQVITKIVFSYVRDIGSTGVYMLDMVTPYRDNQLNEMEDQDPKKKSERMRDLLNKKIKTEKIISTYEYMNNDIVSSTPFLSDWVIDEKKVSKKFLERQKKLDKALEYINSIYKPTTYSSFIQIIADAFLDDGDIGDANLTGSSNKLDLFGVSVGTAPLNKDEQEKSVYEHIKGYVAGDPGTRPGRPVFGKGSNATVVIVAFSMPNIFNVASATVGAVKVIDLFITFFGGDSGSETTRFLNDNEPLMKRLNRFWGKVTSTKLYDYYNEKPQVNEEKGILEVRDADTSEDPNFYGVAVRNLYPAFFKWLDAVEYRINKMMKNFKSALSKEIDKILKNIEELIDDLEYFIDIIDGIISFFEALQTMGLYTLSFTSNGGNDDIVEKLFAAEGFPGVAEGDKLRLIGGLVFCYGAPNPSPGSIDFIGLIKQKMAAINYEAALAKYESSGDSDDDPGSFGDYLASENIGPDYVGSLDKIFKKLF